MVEEVSKLLSSRGQTLALAESCTGGKLSGHFVTHAGVSSFYLGGVVSYSNAIKEKILGVSPSLLKTVGAVSSPVALEMARGVRALMGATWAVSTTGIAGPTGGTDTKPVGTVWFAVVGPGIESVQREVFEGDRGQIQDKAVKFAINFLTQNLKGERTWT